MSLEQEFSDENVLKFGRACFDIAEIINAKSKNPSFNTLLIPSRGAVPFFIGAMYAVRCLEREYPDYAELATRLRVPRMIREFVAPADAIPEQVERYRRINILLCPFTADINTDQFAQDFGLVGRISNEDIINQTRSYWTRVVHGLSGGKKERSRNQYLQLYLFLLKKLEGRTEIADEYEQAPRVDGMAMIDTVISGRASTTILDSFREVKISPQAILIVDNDGNSYKEPFKTKIRIGKDSGQITTLPIPRIFSEDRGACLEGVAGMIYPSLMYYGMGMEVQGKPFFPVGAGSWHPLSQNDPHKKAFEAFCKMLGSAVKVECADYHSDTNKEQALQEMRTDRKSLLSLLKSGKLLSLKSTKSDLEGFGIKYLQDSKTYETSSHVVHIAFSEELSRKLLGDFRKQFESAYI
ncbi:MAG: hypothetical protein KKB21_03455 [Nanoarchaeota archaeon]|nr:hypothetical protein [Nanoarchaeota archaeon]